MSRLLSPFDSIKAFSSRQFGRLSKIARGNRFWVYLAILGPGIIAANAGNDAGGIATYSTVGAEFGYSLLWTFIPMVMTLILVQEMCMRMGIATGQGLADLIREKFGVRLTVLIMCTLLIANAGVIISQFIGISQVSELFGIPRQFTVPAIAVLIWLVVAKGTQERVEQIFLAISLVFLCYVASAFLSEPDWGEVGSEFISPSFEASPAYIFTVMAMIGTTITPFMQFFIQSSTVEKGLDEDDLKLARVDVVVGTTFAMTIAAFIVISTAATLNKTGVTRIDSAATAAAALAPVAGEYATYLFGFGLFGASMLAMGVLPLATAYSVSEALGFEKGISRSFREAPIFLGIFTSLLVIGAIVALIPGLPQIRVLLVTQALNGVLLPIILFSVLKLAGSEEVMGEFKNGKFLHAVAWFITIVISILSILLLGQSFVAIF